MFHRCIANIILHNTHMLPQGQGHWKSSVLKSSIKARGYMPLAAFLLLFISCPDTMAWQIDGLVRWAMTAMQKHSSYGLMVLDHRNGMYFSVTALMRIWRCLFCLWAWPIIPPTVSAPTGHSSMLGLYPEVTEKFQQFCKGTCNYHWYCYIYYPLA